MNWLDKLIPPKVKNSRDRKGIPQGIWVKCSHCEDTLYRPELERNMFVCTKCGNHMRISAQKRLESFFDDGKFETIGENITPVDPLKFRDTKRYKDRLADALKTSEGTESLLVAHGNLLERPVVVAAFDFSFMGGSMASVAGERFLIGIKKAIELKAPFICYSASGGARMQEALISLMQMAKTSAALVQLEKHKLPFISILTDPTMGGVSASLSMLGDVIIAEPNALIGFAGPRVIEQTVREKLPEGFQRAEFLLEHGAIDLIVARHDMRKTVANIVSIMTKSTPIAKDEETSADDADVTVEEANNQDAKS